MPDIGCWLHKQPTTDNWLSGVKSVDIFDPIKLEIDASTVSRPPSGSIIDYKVTFLQKKLILIIFNANAPLEHAMKTRLQ